MIKEITLQEIESLNENDVQIIDIREEYEYESGNLCDTNIPMGEILNSKNLLDTKKKIIIYCQTGRRGAAVAYMLMKHHNIKNIYNLSGGYNEFINNKKNE